MTPENTQDNSATAAAASDATGTTDTGTTGTVVDNQPGETVETVQEQPVTTAGKVSKLHELLDTLKTEGALAEHWAEKEIRKVLAAF